MVEIFWKIGNLAPGSPQNLQQGPNSPRKPENPEKSEIPQKKCPKIRKSQKMTPKSESISSEKRCETPDKQEKNAEKEIPGWRANVG